MTQNAPHDPYGSAPQPPPTPGCYPSGPYPAQPRPEYGYPQAGYPQAGYPQAGYPQPFPMAPEHPQGTLILILGVVSFVCFPLGFVSWHMGKKAEDEMEASGIPYANAGNIKAGKIIGIVTGILTIVGVALFLVYIVLMLIMVGTMFATLPS